MSTLALPPAQPQLASNAEALRLLGMTALTLLLWALAYQPTLLAMVHVWQTSETYAHGFLIAPIAGYLLYRQRAALCAQPVARAPLALAVLLLMGALWTAGTLAAVNVLAELAAVGMLVGALWFMVGTAWLRVAWFPCAFLLLAVPLGDGLTPLLISHTADFVVTALRLVGVPVFREGSFFVIPSGSWSVVTGCSGMRYLMATLTVAALFAHLNYRAVWKQGLFLLLALTVALVANWFRAFGIVMIAHLSDMRLALGVDHYLYGWVFFGIIIFLLMAIGGRWRDELPPPATVCPPLHGVTLRLGEWLPLLALLCVWPLALPLAAPIDAQPLPPLRPALPAAGWHAVAPPFGDWQPHFVGTPQLQAGAARQGEQSCGWQLAWYPGQRPGEELIHAASRLVQEKDDPWRLLAQTLRDSGLPSAPRARQSLLKARDGDRVALVWQWYWVDGQFVADALAVQWLGLRARVSGRSNAGATVLVYVPLADESAQVEASARLRACAGPLLASFATEFAAATLPRGEP